MINLNSTFKLQFQFWSVDDWPISWDSDLNDIKAPSGLLAERILEDYFLKHPTPDECSEKPFKFLSKGSMLKMEDGVSFSFTKEELTEKGLISIFEESFTHIVIIKHEIAQRYLRWSPTFKENKDKIFVEFVLDVDPEKVLADWIKMECPDRWDSEWEYKILFPNKKAPTFLGNFWKKFQTFLDDLMEITF